MKTLLTIESDNFSDNEVVGSRFRVPRAFGADIEGTKVLTIKTKWEGESKTFQFDLKNSHFGEEHLLIEGIIGDSDGIIGRCVFRLTDPK